MILLVVCLPSGQNTAIIVWVRRTITLSTRIAGGNDPGAKIESYVECLLVLDVMVQPADGTALTWADISNASAEREMEL